MTIAFLGKRNVAVLGLVLAGAALALFLALRLGPGPDAAKASSHAEAPLIGQDPRADNTDLYAFVSPDRPGTTTLVANYIPLEAPASGPNFYSFDDSVLYEINIDNTGDGREDLTYQFRFKTTTRNPNTFLYNVGPITSLDDQNWNRPRRARDEHSHAARQRRAALDPRLRGAGCVGGQRPSRWGKGLRRTA